MRLGACLVTSLGYVILSTLSKWQDLLERDDKNDPLFCGFTVVYFFATWENLDFSRPQ